MNTVPTSLSRSRYAAVVVLTGLVYFLMARASLQLAYQQSNASPVWPPSGFAFAMILLMGRRIVPGVFLGAFAGNLFVFLSNASCSPSQAVFLSIVIALGNTGEVLTGEYLIRKFGKGEPLRDLFLKPAGVFRFMVVAGLMCLVSACIGSGAILSGGIITPDILRAVWLTWWTGDFSGVLLVTPLMFIWSRLSEESSRPAATRYYYAEAVMVFAATIIMTGIVFLDWSPHRFLYTRSFIMIPFYLFVVLRLNLRECISVITVSCIMVIWGTAQGLGPLSTLSLNESLLTAQLFVSVAIGTKLMLWTIIYQMRHNESLLAQSQADLEQRVRFRTAELRESEEQFRKAFYGSPAGIAILELATGRIIDVNDAFLRMLEFRREELVGKYPAEKNIYADPAELLKMLNQVRVKGYIKNESFEFKRKSGEAGMGIFSAETIQVKGSPSMVSTIIDVTELKRTEEKFRRMVESAPDAMVIFDRKGKIILVNSKTESLFGYTNEELVGQPAEILLPEGHAQQHEAAINRYLGAPRQRVLGESMELLCRRKDGSRFPVEISLSPLDTAQGAWISSAIRDITSRKNAEAHLLEINMRLTEAQRISRMGNWEWEVATNKLTWSEEMFRIFGVDPATFQPTMENFLAFIHPDDKQLFQDKFNTSLRKPQSFSNYYRIRRADGAVRVLERKGEVFTDDKQVAYKISGTTQDVTERRETEEMLKAKSEELISLNYSLHQSNRELERMNTELSTFAYVASHDLQEPLRKIQTFASRILESETEGMTATGIDYLQRMHRSVHRLHLLLEDLLAYSRLNTTDKVFEQAELEIIFQEEEEEFREQFQEIHATMKHEPLPRVKAIPYQIHQLLHNLISNSVKFRAEGRPLSINVQCRVEEGSSIDGAGLSAHRRYHHITYSDNGIGFEPEYNQRIFEVFQRLHGRNTYPGTGIGLAICKRVVENHQGAISAEGRPGNGATFHIYLPAQTNE